MIGSLSNGRMIELGGAVLLLVAGIILYRRPGPVEGPGRNSYGNQGAVLLLAVAIIVGIHALGGLDYHPSTAEADSFRARGQ